MKYFYGEYRNAKNDLQVFTHKCKTYAVRDKSTQKRYNIPEGTEIKFFEITKTAYDKANDVFTLIKPNPVLRGYFLAMLDGLHEAIDNQEADKDSIEASFEAMETILNVMSRGAVKDYISGEEEYKEAISRLKKEQIKNTIERKTIDMLLTKYSEELDLLKNDNGNVIIS